MLEGYQKDFIEFAIARSVLKFGQFQLKSGRISPYFFNAGQFNTGEALTQLGYFYARALMESGVPFDMLFGPAYKGIPLVSTTAISLARDFGKDCAWAFNRKEAKDHGEGGQMVGAPLSGRLVIVDDVITAGTAIREVMALLEGLDVTPVAVMVAIDRQEKGRGELSAIQEVEKEFGLQVISVVSLNSIIAYLASKEDQQDSLESIRQYRATYGVLQGA